MARPAPNYFTALTTLVQSTLDELNLTEVDISPDRAIWKVHGTIGDYKVRFKEIFNQSGRMYSYYLIHQDEVVVGFDNYPDRRALRKKYGQDFKLHLSELIAHKHGPRKKTLELSKDMTVEKFLNYLKQETYL